MVAMRSLANISKNKIIKKGVKNLKLNVRVKSTWCTKPIDEEMPCISWLDRFNKSIDKKCNDLHSMPEQTSNQNGKYTQDQKCIKDVLLEVRLTSHESAYTLNEVCLQNDQLNGDHCK